MEGVADGSEAFVTFGRGVLKVFNPAKNFGFISPVFKGEDSEGPPLPTSCSEGLWFFGNHALPAKAVPGLEVTFEIWENSQGKAQARSVVVAAEPTANVQHNDGQGREVDRRPPPPKLHPNEPRTIYPSVYVSDVPVEWNESGIRKLHRQLGLNPDAIMGLKFLPFTEVSLGGEKTQPVTGAVILRYINEEAANAGVERLKGHPIQTSTGQTKHLGAKHATPPKWVMQRQQQENDDKKTKTAESQSIQQKVRGIVVRVAMSGYGVIKSADWGEVMWRQYELPTNLRTLQFADKARFQREVENREDFRRLKAIEGKEVEAELYKLPDGQLRASHVRAIQPGPAMLHNQGADAQQPPGFRPHEPEVGSDAPHFMQPPPGGMPGAPPGFGGPPPGFGGPGGLPPPGPPGTAPPPGLPPLPPPGMLPPGMDPYQAQMMMMQMMQQGMGMKEKKKDKKEKKEKKREKRDRRRDRSSSGSASPKRRKIDDDDF